MATEVEKAQAVGLAEVIGVRPAARQLGHAESSLRHWRDQPQFAQLRALTKDAVAEDMFVAFQAGIKRGVELLPDEKDLKAVAVWTGVMYDKWALLTGGATNRSESRDITGTLSDAELIAAIREADRIAAGVGGEAPPATPSEGEG